MSNDNFTPKGEEDVKAEVIKELELDAETQTDLIKKITDERLEHQKTLGTAIRQKRDKAKALDDMSRGKEFYKDKAGLKPKGDDVNKPNEQAGLSRAEAILFSQGYTEEDVVLATKLSKINGVSITKATEDDYFKDKIQARKDKEKADQAGLPASTGSGQSTEKKPGDMSREEHQEYVAAEMGKAGLK